MEPVTAQTTQIWYCDPLVVVAADDQVVFAGKATVEYDPGDVGEFIGRAVVTEPAKTARIEIHVLSRDERMDRGQDIRLGLRDGFTLYGAQADGADVVWHVNGAADAYMVSFVGEETVTLHTDSLAIRDIESGETVFSGPADYVVEPPASAENIESIRLLGEQPLTIEVVDSRQVRKGFLGPVVSEVRTGVDAGGREVEWTFGH